VVRLRHVELTEPVVTATRDAAGQINLAQLALPAQPSPSPAEGKPEAPAATEASASAASAPAISASKGNRKAKAKAPNTAPAWVLEVATAAVRGGTLRWADQTTRPAAALQANEFTLKATGLAVPFAKENAKPFTFEGGLNLQGSPLRFTGEATDQKAVVRATLNALPLQLAAPYLAQTLEPMVTGQLTGDVGVQWQAPSSQSGQAAQAGATGITIQAGPLALEQLAVKQGKAPLASLGKLEIAGAEVPLDTRTATLERLAITQPQLAVERGADGRWMFERWLKTTPIAATPAAPDTTAAGSAPPTGAAPWKLRVADFSLQGGTVSLADKATQRPVALEVTALGITARNLATDGSKPEAFQLQGKQCQQGCARQARLPGHAGAAATGHAGRTGGQPPAPAHAGRLPGRPAGSGTAAR
jgi:uncharacterized protein involved in outer membrane biogenesis